MDGGTNYRFEFYGAAHRSIVCLLAVALCFVLQTMSAQLVFYLLKQVCPVRSTVLK